MQDRIPVNPGRVLISPENGAPYYVTMTRADNATQEGTPLNKNSLLKDATAALFGLGANAVPDDVFSVLSRFQNNLGNEYIWEKLATAAGYKEVQTLDSNANGMIAIIDGPNATTPTYTFQYADKISIDSNGTVSLASPTTFTANYTTFANGYMSTLLGKYFTTSNEFHAGKIFYISTSAEIRTSNNRAVYVEPAYVVTSEYVPANGLVGYVNSPDSNAYPIDDGYTYTALGQLGAKVQIATGSYKGTGTYGKSNKNSLTFDFVPKIVVFANVSSYNGVPMHAIFMRNQSSYIYHTGGPVSWSGKTMSWYTTETNSSNGAKYQLNTSGTTYYYTAIG